MRPLLFLDLDDIICLNDPYGGYDVLVPTRPTDLYERLFDARAVEVLVAVIAELNPQVVLTTSWVRWMDRQAFEALFLATGMQVVAEALHRAWEAPQDSRMMREAAIERWLAEHGNGESFAVLDDDRSGTGLRGSPMDQAGHVVLCEVNVGLRVDHLPAIRAAIRGSR